MIQFTALANEGKLFNHLGSQIPKKEFDTVATYSASQFFEKACATGWS